MGGGGEKGIQMEYVARFPTKPSVKVGREKILQYGGEDGENFLHLVFEFEI